jgi:beta-lactamase superfamily II metal-dependent hydrolase
MTVAIVHIDPEITVLDVGHGNAAVLRCQEGTIVVDAAPGITLPEELERTATTRIEHLVLSHADKDHIGGAVGLLSGDLDVGTLWFNPDALRQTDIFEDLRSLAFRLHEQGRIHVATNLNTGAENALSLGGLEISVLHPDIRDAATGPRAVGHRSGAASANSLSAVLRVSVNGSPQVLLCADIDSAGLATLLSRNVDLSARVLVFPHHGGRSGGPDHDFARDLCTAVNPDLVVFSLGRSGYRNPQPDIVAGLRSVLPEAHIACTQLSARCQASDVRGEATHLADRPAAGRGSSNCCAGSIVVGTAGNDQPISAHHAAFITSNVETPLCRASLDGISQASRSVESSPMVATAIRPRVET